MEATDSQRIDWYPGAMERLIVPTRDAVSCELAGETVILDMPSGRYFALDSIGTQIWEWLQTPCTTASLCARLMQEYDVEEGQCAADVAKLLRQLAEQGLVTFEDAP